MISGTAYGFDLLSPERVIICCCIVEERVDRLHGISLCYLMFFASFFIHDILRSNLAAREGCISLCGGCVAIAVTCCILWLR